MAHDTQLEWKNDVELDEQLQGMYDAYKAAYRTAKTLREDFEQTVIDSVQSELPAGMTIAFSYNFGKLGMAVAPERKPRKRNGTGKAKPTLLSLFR